MSELGVDLFDTSFRDRLEQRMIRLTAELLASAVGWSSTSVRGQEVSGTSYSRWVGAAGAGVELQVLDPAVEVLWQRLSRRNAEPDQVPLDRTTLEGYLPYWDAPHAAELDRYDSPWP